MSKQKRTVRTGVENELWNVKVVGFEKMGQEDGANVVV